MKKLRKTTAVALIAALTMSTLTNLTGVTGQANAAGDVKLHNPRVEYNTRDTIYFGNYWQEDTNGDGVADQKDDKTPIKWQILERNGDELFLLADKALDCKKYNETYESVTWETCTLRSWLNNNFYNAAFNTSEKKGIVTTTVVNDDNPEYDTEGGNDTTDNIYLLSLDEVTNTVYGFRSDRSDRSYCDESRICDATAYAKGQGDCTNDENSSWWWLRSPGSDSDDAAVVIDDGHAYADGYYGVDDDSAVRPALHINLSSLTGTDYSLEGEQRTCVASSEYDLVELGSYDGKALWWRVLQTDDNEAYLLADRYICAMNYNKEYTSITWKDCTLRSWLNDEFYNESFSAQEKVVIKKSIIKNDDNPLYGTEGGEDTEDYVTLLSLEDIVKSEYGFPQKYSCESETRIAIGMTSDGTSQNGSWWWLRSPGYYDWAAARVFDYGYAYAGGSDVDSDLAVRPALHITLSSYPELKVVGRVKAGEEGIQYYDMEGNWIGGDEPEVSGTPEPTNTPEATVTPEPTKTPEVTAEPTKTPEVTPEPTKTPEVTPKPSATPSATNTPAQTSQAPQTGSNTQADATVPAKQTITTAKIPVIKAKTLAKKAVSFKLKAKTTGDGKLTYKVTSGAKYAKVTAKGKVTIKKKTKKGAKIKIQIKAGATDKYTAAKKTVVIKVK